MGRRYLFILSRPRPVFIHRGVRDRLRSPSAVSRRTVVCRVPHLRLRSFSVFMGRAARKPTESLILASYY